MADSLIKNLTAYDPPLDADVLPIVDIVNDATKKVTWANIKAAIASATQTFTNKRITPRVGTSASSATHTIDSDAYDVFLVTAQAEAVTFAEPTGTETSMQKLLIGIKDDGTARAITWNAAFVVIGCTLPTTTVLGKYTYVGCMWNATASKWHVLAVGTQA